ncbi:MAG TPA: hypothetical protein VFQ53_02275 [Kofleriaceae bacterium]|nr:hypothetical protein [Kofleriaceae bacterium]
MTRGSLRAQLREVASRGSLVRRSVHRSASVVHHGHGASFEAAWRAPRHAARTTTGAERQRADFQRASCLVRAHGR